MKNKKYFMPLVLFLVVLEITSMFFVGNVISDKETILDNVKLKDEDKIPEGLAIMLETENNSNEYTESNNSSWPSTGYKFNKEKSGCIDSSGNIIEDSISYNAITNIVTVETWGTTSCYVYFDKRYSLESLCTSGEDTLGECLTKNNNVIESLNDNIEGGLYRYQGTQELVDDNYICFGTSDKQECLNNKDKYMYRIIGIDENNQLKLIKKEALDEAMQWHNATGVTWPNSDLFKNINGEKYLTNSTYMPSGWSNKIVDYEWKYGNIANNDTGVNQNGIYVHNLENVWTNIIKSHIALIYISDYYLSYNSTISCHYTNEYNEWKHCAESWIHINNNDGEIPHTSEWTMVRNISTHSFRISTNGNLGNYNMTYAFSIRPVFYLTSNETYTSGNGTLNDPIMLNEPKETASETIIRKDTESDIGLQQSIIEGDDLYRFSGTQGNTGINNYVCLGTTSKCESGSDNMYRIIGVNPNNGEIKVIKEIPWNSSTKYAWHSSNSDTTWLTSDLYNNTVSKIYDNLSFKDMIVANHSWNVGTAGSTSIATRASVIDYENNTTGTANIGIMSLTDYYLAYNGDRNWYSSYDMTTNWIGGYLNGNTTITEWTMTFFGDHNGNYRAWNGHITDGRSGRSTITSENIIRPVFYLKPNVYITNPEATGASTDPFILAY